MSPCEGGRNLPDEPRYSVSESRTSVRRLKAVERQRQALELRLGGATLADIAGVLGYASASGAVNAIDSALRRTLEEPAAKVRKLELRRLDLLLLGIWNEAIRGDDKSIGRVLNIMERRARYLGLDTPEALVLDVKTESEQGVHATFQTLILTDPIARELAQRLFVNAAMGASDAGGTSLVRKRRGVAAGPPSDDDQRCADEDRLG